MMRKIIKIILITITIICVISTPIAFYVRNKRSSLYGYSYKLYGYTNYDTFYKFYNRNIKNKNEKAFILNLKEDFGEEELLILGLHDCGKHMLWCKKSNSFHYLRNTVYRQCLSLKNNNETCYCYIFYPQYYQLDNPKLEWNEVSVNAFKEISPYILCSNPDSIFYELFDTTQERSVLKIHFSDLNDSSIDYEIFDEVKNKLLEIFTKTYL